MPSSLLIRPVSTSSLTPESSTEYCCVDKKRCAEAMSRASHAAWIAMNISLTRS